ncbi:MAG: SusC/RagA family TonB-linked outer membrane protein [Gemmatimonadaceae bacterium]
MRFSIRRLLAVAGALVVLPAVAAAQSPATITGRVTAEGGTPIIGASVFLEGLQIGAQTTDDGRYTILVPAARATGSATLTARSIGYRPVSQPVTLTSGATITRDFALAINPLRLGEVVVTGAGTTSTRERLTSVINSVDTTSLKRSAEPQNVVAGLAGKAPNVEIRSQSGEPGASASIKIRGGSSLSGQNQPLFVVDGQPIDNSTMSVNGGDGSTVTQNRAADINPNDIEAVDILKGAAAAAIYGARAANGVVLITTKRGHSGAPRYTYSSTATFDGVNKTMPLQKKYGFGSAGVNVTCALKQVGDSAYVGVDAPDCVPMAPRATDKALRAANSAFGAPIAAGTPTYDHSEEIFDTGATFDNNLSISGGNDKTTYFLSGGLTNQDGTIVGPNNRYNRASVRLKGTQQLTSQLSVTGNLSYVDTRGRYVQKGSNTSGLLLGALRTPPDFNNKQSVNQFGQQRPYRFPNGSSTESLQGSAYYDNPFFVANNPGNRSELGRSISNVNVNYNPLSWLTLQYTFGADYYNDWRLEALPLTAAGNPTGVVFRYDINNLELDHNLIATARHSFSDNFNGSLTLGQNLNSRRNRQVFVTGQDLIAPEPLALQNTISYIPTETRSQRHIEAYFAQGEVQLYNQLVLNAGIRNDGFSTFGASKRRNNFPKAGAAWTFTNALGNTDQKGILSYGKLRFSYGETGKEPPTYSAVADVNSLTALFGSGFGDVLKSTQSGIGGVALPGTAGNTSLRPERTRENEWGADFGFLDQRADLGITYYNKRSTDVIIAVPVSAAVGGYTTAFQNAAALQNKGLEVALNVRPYTAQNVAVELGVNFGRNRGKVLSLAGADFIPYTLEGFTGSIGSSTVGYAPGVIRGSDFVRCGQAPSDLELPLGSATSTTVGAACAGAKKGALYLDSTGYPVVDPTDRVIADPNPKWSAGYTASVRLLNKVTLAGLLDVRHGGQMWNGTRGALYRFGTHKDTEIRDQQGTFGKNVLADVYPDVTGPGAGVVAFSNLRDWQNWYQTDGGSASDAQAQFVEDASFVKLRELSLTYTLDQPFIKNFLGLSSADLRLAGRNLHTWTKYKGLDPETNLGGSEFLTQGVDFFNNPQTRSFVVSLTLNR